MPSAKKRHRRRWSSRDAPSEWSKRSYITRSIGNPSSMSVSETAVTIGPGPQISATSVRGRGRAAFRQAGRGRASRFRPSSRTPASRLAEVPAGRASSRPRRSPRGRRNSRKRRQRRRAARDAGAARHEVAQKPHDRRDPHASGDQEDGIVLVLLEREVAVGTVDADRRAGLERADAAR